VANKGYANAARRKRQEKTPKATKGAPAPGPQPVPPQVAPAQLDELIRNLNWLFAAIRSVAESESGRAILDRLARLATSACIVDGLTLDSEGWAALLNLANGRSFSAMKNRRKIASHKPGQTLMFSASDLLRASVRSSEGPDSTEPRTEVSGPPTADRAG
jgi:hypothetical protein